MLPPDGARAWSVETCASLQMRAETRTTHEMMRVTWSARVREVAPVRAARENALAHTFSFCKLSRSPHPFFWVLDNGSNIFRMRHQYHKKENCRKFMGRNFFFAQILLNEISFIRFEVSVSES